MKIRTVPALAAALVGLISTLTAQQASPSPAAAPPTGADPFIKGPKPAPAAQPATPQQPEQVVQLMPQGIIRAEYFSLPHTLARKMMRQFPQQTALYTWLGNELENPKSEVKLERMSLLKVRGGQHSVVQEINEYPFPTEFDPAQIPQSIGLGIPLMMNGAGDSDSVKPPPPIPAPTPTTAPPPSPSPSPPSPAPAPGPQGPQGETGVAAPPAVIAPGALPAHRQSSPWPYVPVTSSAFSTKNTGWTLEVEMTIGADGHTVDLQLAPEHIRLVGQVPQMTNGEIVQPVFESSKLTTQILTIINQPTLVGTISPPVSSGAPGGNADNRTRLLFITVTPSR